MTEDRPSWLPDGRVVVAQLVQDCTVAPNVVARPLRFWFDAVSFWCDAEPLLRSGYETILQEPLGSRIHRVASVFASAPSFFPIRKTAP